MSPVIEETRLVAQFALGLVFLLSASGKLLRPAAFARGVTEYRILPESLGFGFGLLLIPVELLLAVSHLTGWQLALAAPAGLAALASFAVAVAVNLGRGRVLPCYCFGGRGGETISARTMARLLLLLAAELLVLTDPALFRTSQFVYPGRAANLSELGLLFFWATFLLVAGLWLLSVTDLMELLRPCPTCGSRTAKAEADPGRRETGGAS